MNFAVKVVIAISTLVTTAYARLGETKDECKTRYGPVIGMSSSFRPDFPQYIFVKNEVEIRVRFVAEKVGELMVFNRSGLLTEKLITEILNANSQGAPWRIDPTANKPREKMNVRDEYRAYVRADGKATGNYSVRGGIGILTIQSGVFLKAFNAPVSGF